MKKIKWIAPILIMSLLFGMVACKHSTDAPEPHHHTFATEWTSDETNHWHAATCEHTTLVIGIAAHSFGDWTVTKEPTCTQEGKKTVYCTVCLDEKEETIPEKEHSGIWETTEDPTETESGKMQIVCEVCGETVTKGLQPVPEGFVLVKAGTFQMGSNYEDEYYESHYKPVHEVTITKPFYMGKCEVTQAEYEKYCSYTGSYSPNLDDGDGDNYPVYEVSWYNAIVYCNKRSIAEGLTPCYSINDSTNPEAWELPTAWNDPLCDTWDEVECNWNANGYRLPTEAEWEYAARVGDNTVDSLTYSGTSNVNELGEYAWSQINSDFKTHEVGTKKPNAYGLFDMSGNVWEWCWNWYTDSYDAETEGGSDPTGISAGSERVLRGGGGWGCDHIFCCAVSFRTGYTPYYGGYNYGFRVVRQAN